MKIAGGVYACQSCQAESNGNAKEVIADQNKNEKLRDSSGLKLAKVSLSLRPFSPAFKDKPQKRSDSALALNSWWPWNKDSDNEPNSPLFDSKIFERICLSEGVVPLSRPFCRNETLFICRHANANNAHCPYRLLAFHEQIGGNFGKERTTKIRCFVRGKHNHKKGTDNGQHDPVSPLPGPEGYFGVSELQTQNKSPKHASDDNWEFVSDLVAPTDWRCVIPTLLPWKGHGKRGPIEFRQSNRDASVSIYRCPGPHIDDPNDLHALYKRSTCSFRLMLVGNSETDAFSKLYKRGIHNHA